MYDKIVIVTKQTALEELVLRLNSWEQARFYLEQNGLSFVDYEASDTQYRRAVDALAAQLPRGVKQQFIDRSFLPTFQFGDHDLVVTIGPDGLVVNTAKYLSAQPILALNPDPARIDGVLVPFTYTEAGAWLDRAMRGTASITPISMAQATLNDGQTLFAVNDLFIGPRGHHSARYTLSLGGRSEQQSSSGIIVSTGAGCTGWLRSVTAGAWQVARYFNEAAAMPPTVDQIALGWDANKLWYAVREPFVSKTSAANLVFGQIAEGQELVLVSHMPDDGVIFSDGIDTDYLNFNSGTVARIGLSSRKAHLFTKKVAR